ncbi:hypothetical protein FOCC_FOCC006765 [Frankliniella occidentalis]|uniref:VWFA and cache domain-containing protein 1 n=1 Tax=Frankliniella occidentalis TaxID=133901 RepID=A0A6J1SEV3_FRAOC|nr:VWFA and cache domain-containing protein 1 [Frankliniella occidentalis]KAE8746531.1 hypothetical protein FOCC_FOCC006765 [Frankliniella occidentalis]
MDRRWRWQHLISCAVVFCLVEASSGSYSLVLSNGTNLFSYPSTKFEGNLQVVPDVNVDLSLDKIKEEVSPSSIDGLLLQDVAPNIASCLRDVCNKELGVLVLQEIYDNLEFEPTKSTDEKRVENIASSIDRKLQENLNLLSKTRSAVENAIHERVMGPTQLPSAAHPCFRNSIRDEYYDVRYTRPIRRLGHPGPRHGFNLTSVFVQNSRLAPSLKLQYLMAGTGFSSSSDHLLQDMPCNTFDETRLRSIFLATTSPDTKRVIIMIDYGRSVSVTQLELAKVLARSVIETLSHHDHVGLIGLAEDALLPMNDGCTQHSLPLATHETKYHLLRYIDGLTRSKGPTNHSLGFKNVFEIIANSVPSNATAPILVVYLSRGLLSSLTELKTVLQTIAEGREATPHDVIINTCALIDDGKPLMLEKHFLQDVASQNFSKYNISILRDTRISPGILVSANTTSNLGPMVGQLLSGLPVSGHKTAPLFFLPDFDSVSKAMVLSIAQPCEVSGRIVGVVGIDLSLSEVVENITYFNTYAKSYSFFINKEGYTLMHPSLSRPTFSYEQPMATDIKYLENKPGFDSVREKILNETNGNKIIKTEISSQGHLVSISYSYTWRHLKSGPYIAVLVSVHQETGQQPSHLQSVPLHHDMNIVYHKFQHMDKYSMCRHLRLPSSFDVGSVFLSASCFQSPYNYLEGTNSQSSQMIESYMAYLHDQSRVLANPGLKPGVRDDVGAVSGVVQHWKQQQLRGKLRKYTVRRYVATPSGVLVSYPSSPIEDSFDPTRRHWYTRAMEFPGRVVLTAPYLDVGGAGYIVTLSHTIFEGRPAALHSSNDAVVAVIGVDFTMGYLYKLLLDTMPFCEERNIKCFLMDDKGYLIAHPSLTETSGRQPLEQQHITHKESLLAHDILSHKGFVTKRVCNNFSDRTMQRFYQFNTSVSGILTNLVHGEHCVQYQVIALSGTNVFLGVVNQTCDVTTAFCPCSTEDRNCLNCARVEQTECECPCECPLGINYCTGDLQAAEASNPSCSNFPETQRPPVYVSTSVSNMPICSSVNVNCESFQSHSECRGVLGCEWCQLSSDGETPLEVPFCTQFLKCFNGVRNAGTPYGESSSSLRPSGSGMLPSTPTMGPVAGGTLGFFLGLAFVLMLYCYRQHSNGTQAHGLAHAYLSSGPDTGVRMSQLDNEPDDADILDSAIKGHSNQILHIDGITPISPYRVNTGYKRPAGGDSDHGYSTMTPHDDSETLASAEPLILGACSPSKRSVSHLMSQSISPNATSDSPPQTSLMLSHQVLAPVTVHMVDI